MHRMPPLTVPLRLEDPTALIDARHRMVGDLDTRARVSTRPVVCTTCRRPLLPSGAERPCACQAPTVYTVDQLLTVLEQTTRRQASELDAAGGRCQELQAAVAGAMARAELAEAANRELAAAVGRFVANARAVLGVEGAPVPAQTAAALAEALAEESR